MDFLVLGRREIKKFRTNKKHIVISICDTNERYVYLYRFPSRIAVLKLKFDDLDKEIEGYSLFTKEDAERILNFVSHYKDKIELIICQCEAGISRSAGVAGALSLILNGYDQYFFDHYMPNRIVYRLILKEADRKGLMDKVIQGEREIMKGKFKTGEEVFNDLYKKIEKALAEADKMKVEKQKNLMGNKKKYITAIIRELE